MLSVFARKARIAAGPLAVIAGSCRGAFSLFLSAGSEWAVRSVAALASARGALYAPTHSADVVTASSTSAIGSKPNPTP